MTFIDSGRTITNRMDESRLIIPDLNTVLCAEDDDNYALLLKCAFKRVAMKLSFHRVSDGSEAISYLKGEGKYADRKKHPLPYIVLADLKMPKINGFELLDWIRRDSAIPHLPVIVLTSSDELKDIQKAYTKGANSFLMKPFSPEDLKEIVDMVDKYWIRLNKVDADHPLAFPHWNDPKPFGRQN